MALWPLLPADKRLSTPRTEVFPLSCTDARSRPVSFAASLREIEGEHTFQMARPLKHLLMPQRAHRVVVSGAPVILHREPRELVVLRVAFVMLRAVDEVHDIV